MNSNKKLDSFLIAVSRIADRLGLDVSVYAVDKETGERTAKLSIDVDHVGDMMTLAEDHFCEIMDEGDRIDLQGELDGAVFDL